MHIPEHFRVHDQQQAQAFVAAQAFGQMVSQVDGQPFATPMPYLLDDDGQRLIGHLARHNPQWRELDGQSVLIICQGPHGYVSPRWYAGAGVPTWNYQVAHVRGQARVFHNTERLAELVADLTRQHEQGLPGEPWRPDYPASMLAAIVGISIDVESIHCAFKLSQNRPAVDRAEVKRQLDHRGESALARAMDDAERLQHP